MWDSTRPDDLTDRIALCDRVIGRDATPATIQRDHDRLLRGWDDGKVPDMRVREVRIPWGPTIAAQSYVLPLRREGELRP